MSEQTKPNAIPFSVTVDFKLASDPDFGDAADQWRASDIAKQVGDAAKLVAVSTNRHAVFCGVTGVHLLVGEHHPDDDAPLPDSPTNWPDLLSSISTAEAFCAIGAASDCGTARQRAWQIAAINLRVAINQLTSLGVRHAQ